MRPIDGDALEQAIQELKKSPWYNGGNGNYERIIRAEVVGIVTDLCVKQAPTLDYEPVRHGYWRFVQYDVNPQVGNWHCSVCNRIPLIDAIGFAKYCPNCGARMDAKEDER